MFKEDLDLSFAHRVADVLIALPGVRSVSLGGSRALGTATPTSDWDLALYYRDDFDPDDLRAVGWPGQVFDLRAWGGGVFNGGAWLTIEDRKVDVLYRDLGDIDHELAEAEAGRFHWEPLMFNLAGIPSYLLLAELASTVNLRGEPLPVPTYPAALREHASQVWRSNADLTLGYAEKGFAERGQLAEVAATLTTAAMQTGQAVLAERGAWVTNEKRLIDRAGLRGIDAIIENLAPEPAQLIAAVRTARELLTSTR